MLNLKTVRQASNTTALVNHLLSPTSRRKTMKLALGTSGDHKNSKSKIRHLYQLNILYSLALVTINSEEELYYINPPTSISNNKCSRWTYQSYKPRQPLNFRCFERLGKDPNATLKDLHDSVTWEMYQNLPLIRRSAYLKSLTPFHFYFVFGLIWKIINITYH
jgi:hypothetical protein